MSMLKKKGKKKVQGVPQSQTAGPSQTPRGRGNRQIQTSTNRTNVRKAPTISSLFRKRGNRNAKRTEKAQEQNDTM